MRPDAFEPGRTVEEMLRKDLDLEYQVRGNLAKGAALCEQHRDYVNRDMLVKQLADTEEDHTRWLEQQLCLIEMVGLQNYQQARMGGEPSQGSAGFAGRLQPRSRRSVPLNPYCQSRRKPLLHSGEGVGDGGQGADALGLEAR